MRLTGAYKANGRHKQTAVKQLINKWRGRDSAQSDN